jgi:hypothetical protein
MWLVQSQSIVIISQILQCWGARGKVRVWAQRPGPPSWCCTHALLQRHTHIYALMHTHTHTQTHTHTHTHTHTYTHTHTHTHTHTVGLEGVFGIALIGTYSNRICTQYSNTILTPFWHHFSCAIALIGALLTLNFCCAIANTYLAHF